MSTVFLLLLLASVHCSISYALPIPSSNETYFVSDSAFPGSLQMNLQELSNYAMNSMQLSNQSLLELYRESAEIINGTNGADSVLLELDPVDGDNSEPRILVMAVFNPDAPSHEDILNQFSLYFVNLTDSLPIAQTTSILSNSSMESLNTSSTWSIFTNFLKNQANAVVGAFLMPLNVGAQAIQQLSTDHAKYVAAGTTFGSAISKPIIMQAIALPNNIASRVVNVTNTQAVMLQSAVSATKEAATVAVDSTIDGVEAGGTLAVKYVARPVGAFVGANANLAGQAVSGLGHGLHQAAIQLNLLGDRIGSKAQSVVSGGSWALAWGMDNDVLLPHELKAMESNTQP